MNEELRRLRNKMLYPSGVPFEKGCEFLFPTNRFTVPTLEKFTIIIEYTHKKETWFDAVMNLDDGKSIQEGDVMNLAPDFEKNQKIAILGKPVSLPDVLRMIDMDRVHDFAFSNDYVEIIRNDIPQRIIQIDLSKEIEDQLEACEDLLTLFKK